MVLPQDIWQVEVSGKLYTADFTELTVWVADGALQPQDKVRRGELRWIEAGKVPALVPHFNAKRDGTPPPAPVVTITEPVRTNETTATTSVSEPVNPTSAVINLATMVDNHPNARSFHDRVGSEYINTNSVPPQPVSSAITQNTVQPGIPVSIRTGNTTGMNVAVSESCSVHSDVAAVFVCKGCSLQFCKACPTSYGGNVKICPSCGSLCEPKQHLAAEKRKNKQFETARDQGFGFTDFTAALAYPFRYKTALFVGAFMFAVFSLGRGAVGFGSVYFIFGSFACAALASALCFGVLAHTAESFSLGRMESFMPDFDDFNAWDDVLHPFFVSIGAYISSFGVFLVPFAIAAYLVFSAMSANQEAIMGDIQKLPGTPYYNARNTLDQTRELNKVVGDIQQQNEDRLKQQTELENGNTVETKSVEAGPNAQKTQLGSPLPKQDESQFWARLLSYSAPLVVIGFIGLIWGFFYFPVACIVAGYTRSFFSTINPLVGLDTIFRLGFDYVKLLFFFLFLLGIWAVFAFFIRVLFLPFEMPAVGNLPATAITSVAYFYFTVVFSCLVGFLLFKSGDKLKLPR